MAPAEFVPIAERSGLIIPVGLFVLERAARDLNRWMRNDPNAAGLFTSVNISSRQLLRHDLLNDLRAILARADLPGSALKLELTESLVMENPEYASQVLARCRELGIGLSLDDFGTGYSSLAYLQRFPFDTIKIDQSFVAEMEPGEPAVVLAAIVALGHDLEMDIVAEGIESEEVAVELAKLGCEYGQGFQFGHPIPASGVPTFLRSFGQEIALQKQAENQPAPKAIGQSAPPKAQTVVPPLPPTGTDRQVSAAPVTPVPSRSERRPAQQRPETRRTALPIDQTVSPSAARVEKPEIKPAEPLRPKKPSKDDGNADAIVIEHDANEPAAEPPVRSSKTSRDKAGAKSEAQTDAKTEEQDAKHKASNGVGSHQKPEPADDDRLAASSDLEPAKASMPKPPTRPRSSELDRYRESSARSGTNGTPKPLLPVWNPTGTNGAASSDDGADDSKKDDASPAEASAAETAVERQAGAK
jgi:EAL domain-containing protein (putative c-di-GMP-specific phosphodiesterase class I)